MKDDPFLRVEAVVLLEEAGIPVAEFAAAERALAYVDHNAEKIGLVVAEIRFPSRLTGLQLALRVAAKWPWIKIAVTAAPESVANAQIPKNILVTTTPLLPADLLAHAFQAGCTSGS